MKQVSGSPSKALLGAVNFRTAQGTSKYASLCALTVLARKRVMSKASNSLAGNAWFIIALALRPRFQDAWDGREAEHPPVWSRWPVVSSGTWVGWRSVTQTWQQPSAQTWVCEWELLVHFWWVVRAVCSATGQAAARASQRAIYSQHCFPSLHASAPSALWGGGRERQSPVVPPSQAAWHTDRCLQWWQAGWGRKGTDDLNLSWTLKWFLPFKHFATRKMNALGSVHSHIISIWQLIEIIFRCFSYPHNPRWIF